MTSVLVLVACGLMLLYVGLLAMLWRIQERIVFQPPAHPPETHVDATRVDYRASDGVSLFAYVVGDCRSARTVLLAFHGNADLARWFVPWATEVARRTGACVILPEYRGYDGLRPFPSYATSAVDARAAFDYARETLGVPPSRMVFFGHSLGSAIAAELAAVEMPHSLVLQSPFSTARDMAARMFLPGLTLFWGAVSRVHFDTIARVRGLCAPVYVAHGDADLIIPVRMGREVFAAAACPGELLIVHGAGHNDVAGVGGGAYWEWLARAIRGEVAGATGPGATGPGATGPGATAPDAAAETRSAP
ncbi:MAG TPA: alpha/beta hydrolase [Gemmatimonadaceae bacterium]|nr:alpha/beta hydrolase [Gemmatimonadaceae bacterium]